MEAQWLVDRQHLRQLLQAHSEWTLQDYADAVGRSHAWVKKWVKRLRAVSADDDSVLLRQSSTRKQPPPKLSQLVVDRILELRDQPPQNLGRIPGPKAILYYLHQEAETSLAGERLPRSTRTIWQILRQHQRIQINPIRTRTPVARPEPLTSWQIDFKDASTVPADPSGKQQHVVEVLDTVDVGTSILLDAQPRADYSMATALQAMAETVQRYGLPDVVTMDRDARFVGDTLHADAPSPFMRFWLCLGVQVTVLPPRRPDLNAFVERYHRSYEEECLQVHRPADLEAVKSVTAAFQQHYNWERPHQGLSCGNQPPRVALANVPVRPPVPSVVDRDRWVEALHGRRFVRKVQANTAVKLDKRYYYATQEMVGRHITLRVDARERSLVMEYEGCEFKRVPLHGVGQSPLPFATFVEQLCREARGESKRWCSISAPARAPALACRNV
jgi:transposase InsO family protein